MKAKLLAAAIGISIMASAGSAGAAIIIENIVSGSEVSTFNSISPNFYAGTLSDGGATYGESFAGQTVSTDAGGRDTLSGAPSAPLTLQTDPVANLNLGILSVGDNVIYGAGGSVSDGDGAISVLFDQLTDVVSFDMIGSNGGGTFTVDFFGASGALLDSITQSTNDQLFGFRVTSGDLIHGISITNTDSGGVGYDDVRFNLRGAPEITQVSEPGMIVLLGLGVLGLGIARRRKAI